MANLIFNFDGKCINNFNGSALDFINGLDGCIFTNGCFDILHRGHIELFKFCYSQKKVWQPVVVAVNTDRSIQQLKGNNRPILSLEDRVGVLKAIQWIDYIITFDTKSVFPLIERLKPKIIVKGGNYSKKSCAEKDRIIGEEFVNSYGGKVLVAPFVAGISTTEIIRRIMVPIPEKTDW